MDPLSLTWLIIIVLVSFVLFYLALLEKSLLLTNPYKLQIKADEGHKKSKRILILLNKIERSYATILLLNVIGYVCLTILLFLLCQKAWPSLNPITIGFIVFGFIFLIGGLVLKFAPHAIANNIPDTITNIFYFPLFILTYVFIPLSSIYEWLSYLFIKKKKQIPEEELSEDELQDAVEQISDDGLIEEEQGEIIQSVLDFDDTNVKEILTPKEKIYCLDIKELEEGNAQDILLKCPYSRIPVYEDEKDNFIGILLIKTYFKEICLHNKVKIRDILQKPYFVYSRIMIDELFDGFKKHHTHIALVRDNKKQIIGMVTMEDVLEEIVSGIAEPNKQGGKR